MRIIRRTIIPLVTALLVLLSVPAFAQLEQSRFYGFTTSQRIETETGYILRSVIGTVEVPSRTAGAVIVEYVYTEQDGLFQVDRYRYPLTDVTVQIAPNLSTASLSADMNGVPVSVDLSGDAEVKTNVLIHPDPFETGRDNNGAMVGILMERLRHADATVTIGGASTTTHGSIYSSSNKWEVDNGVGPKGH